MDRRKDHPGAEAPETLDGFLALAWSRLEAGLRDRAAAARFVTLATLGHGEGPEARTVVLRGLDPHHGILEIHTDTDSPKVAEIASAPKVALLVWDAAAQIQIRARAEAEMHPGTAEAFAALPPGAQRVYGGTPLPGAALDRPEDHDPKPDPARFMRVLCRIERFDLLHLGADRHRRAVFTRAKGWQGQWCAP